MSQFKFVRHSNDKHGKEVAVVYSVPAEDVMSRDGEALIAGSTSACHISQANVVGKTKRFVDGDVDYVVEVA